MTFVEFVSQIILWFFVSFFFIHYISTKKTSENLTKLAVVVFIFVFFTAPIFGFSLTCYFMPVIYVIVFVLTYSEKFRWLPKMKKKK